MLLMLMLLWWMLWVWLIRNPDSGSAYGPIFYSILLYFNGHLIEIHFWSFCMFLSHPSKCNSFYDVVFLHYKLVSLGAFFMVPSCSFYSKWFPQEVGCNRGGGYPSAELVFSNRFSPMSADILNRC